jgi:hypothetical protein
MQQRVDVLETRGYKATYEKKCRSCRSRSDGTNTRTLWQRRRPLADRAGMPQIEDKANELLDVYPMGKCRPFCHWANTKTSGAMI